MGTRKRGLIIKGFDMLISPEEEVHSIEELWKSNWIISYHNKKEDDREVGTLRFDGPPEKGCVEIHISIKHEEINRGYATRALKAISEWCFARDKLFVINAHISSENIPALKAFTAAGFIFRSKENGIEHYSMIKSPSAWLGLYLIIGIWTGMLIGIVIANMPVGFVCGVILGLICGKAMELRDIKIRKDVLGTDLEK